MDPITTTAKVMQNFTICIAQPIRERLKLEKGDQVLLRMDERGEVRIIKAVNSLDELAGMGRKSFKALGGGESFLKNERSQWKK